jgi:uncharacterized protein (DUF1778 family)
MANSWSLDHAAIGQPGEQLRDLRRENVSHSPQHLERKPWRSSMTKGSQRKGHLVSIRVQEAGLALIDRAAKARGLSRTSFVRGAAVRAAEGVQMEERSIRMSADGFMYFIEQVDRPVAAVPALIEVMQRPAPWEQ